MIVTTNPIQNWSNCDLESKSPLIVEKHIAYKPISTLNIAADSLILT